MAKDKAGRTGGIHIGDVRHDVKMKAGRDLVAGDKTTTFTQTTSIQKGFAGEEQKQQFQGQIEQLREGLRELKGQIEAHVALSQDEKEELISEVLQQVKALKEIKEQSATAQAGKPAPVALASAVEKTLVQAGGLMEKVRDLTKSAQRIGQTASESVTKFASLIVSLRHLFGLS